MLADRKQCTVTNHHNQSPSSAQLLGLHALRHKHSFFTWLWPAVWPGIASGLRWTVNGPWALLYKGSPVHGAQITNKVNFDNHFCGVCFAVLWSG